MRILSNPNAKYAGYFSHPIRGKGGESATDEEIRNNCEAASRMANAVRAFFPEIDLYVPADHDEVYQFLREESRLPVDDMLWADCKIVRDRDFLMAYMPEHHVSDGMRTELNYAVAHGIPTFMFSDFDVSVRMEFILFLLDEVRHE